ncbi:MAG: leucyl aminopeptidase [Calditrichaeota bacterium]|nr:MAG: leucyl aminopeptidase [Calditrichota bacterium]
MQVKSKYIVVEQEVCEALVIGVFKDTANVELSNNETLLEFCQKFLKTGDFKGDLNETSLLYPEGLLAKRILLVGLGERDKYSIERLRQAVGTAARTLMKLGVQNFALALETISTGNVKNATQAATEGAILATYQYSKFKEIKPEEQKFVESMTLLYQNSENGDAINESVRVGTITAEATNFARNLQNDPGNEMTPTRMAEIAREMAKQLGLRCEVLDRKQMEKLGMGALLGVARGSAEPPKFIILEYNAEQSGQETMVFVGKGITFDSGGISIKPSEKMEEMKFDMSGGAAVLGALKAIAQLKLPFHVVGLIPATENLPSGTSMKPGDILRASSGKTIEVINTDAEGRLILADALAYAKRYKPRAVIDLATLTGACVVALGHYATGLFGKDEDLKQRLKKAGEMTGERLWELPLWDDYFEDIKSDYADIKNSAGRWGGAITAAAFLANFAEDYPWAHLDIAGTAWTDKEKPYIPKGGTGVGVRLLVQFLRDWLAEG